MADQSDSTVHDDAPPTVSKNAEAHRDLLGEAVTINKPASELYEFWRNPANLARFMENVRRIEPIDATRSRWTVKGPADSEYTWVSVITHEEPGKALNWQSEEGAEVANSGRIEFREAGARGTVVRAVIAYKPPAGAIGKLVAKLFQREPHIQTRRELRRFKQLMETGEIATAARTKKQYDEEKA